MTLAGFFIRLSSKQSARRFEQTTQDPMGAQTRKLQEIIQANARTEYGKRYGFESVRTIKDYQSAVPVVDYEQIRPDVERMLNGEEGILTAEKPVLYAQTSGSTGDPKYIPVTPTCQGRDHKDVMRTWLWHASQAYPRMFDHQIATLVSPAVEGYTPSGVPFGSTSGHMYQNIPWIVRRSYAVPYCAFQVEDYQAKYYAIMRTAMEQSVSSLCTANPSSILKLCEKGHEFSEDILRDIHDGTLSERYPFETAFRTELEKHYRPNPRRAHALGKMRSSRDGIIKPGDYWPDLALIGCWKGGTVGHYLEKFDKWFALDGKPTPPVRDWGYLASEMRGSVPVSDEGAAGVLTVATNFFEFVTTDQVAAQPEQAAAWDYHTVGELEDGREYYVFVTTTGGLYRYDINDIVRVEGFYHRTPQVVFQRKGRGMTNLTGEKLSVNQVVEAIHLAGRSTGTVVLHFKVEADQANNRYVVRAEFDQVPPEETQREFLCAFEKHLQSINIEYQSKRKSQRLAPSRLHVMREGWYERDRRELVRGGRRVFQAKTEVLSPIKAQTDEIRHELLNVIDYDDSKALTHKPEGIS